MTKLDRASAILPLILEAHKKGLDIDFDLHKNRFEVWHWLHHDDKYVKFEVNDKRGFEKVMNYLKNLLK